MTIPIIGWNLDSRSVRHCSSSLRVQFQRPGQVSPAKIIILLATKINMLGSQDL